MAGRRKRAGQVRAVTGHRGEPSTAAIVGRSRFEPRGARAEGGRWTGAEVGFAGGQAACCSRPCDIHPAPAMINGLDLFAAPGRICMPRYSGAVKWWSLLLELEYVRWNLIY